MVTVRGQDEMVMSDELMNMLSVSGEQPASQSPKSEKKKKGKLSFFRRKK